MLRYSLVRMVVWYDLLEHLYDSLSLIMRGLREEMLNVSFQCDPFNWVAIDL